MMRNGQALFYKEIIGDAIIKKLRVNRQTFKLFINPEDRIIKVFGLINSDDLYFIITIQYFNFKLIMYESFLFMDEVTD